MSERVREESVEDLGIAFLEYLDTLDEFQDENGQLQKSSLPRGYKAAWSRKWNAFVRACAARNLDPQSEIERLEAP